MHFRERRQIVQIIRAKYDPSSKKGKNEIVGRLVKANPQFSDALEAALSKEERKEVVAWIEGHAKVQRLKRNSPYAIFPNNWHSQRNGLQIKKAAVRRVF